MQNIHNGVGNYLLLCQLINSIQFLVINPITGLQTPDLIDFDKIKNLKPECITVIPSLELSSDHSPTILALTTEISTFDLENLT